MIPETRLHDLTSRFQFLEARMSEGAAADEIAALAKEYSDLKPVIAAIDAYRQCQSDFEEAQLMLDDPEMKELAEEELPALKARWLGFYFMAVLSLRYQFMRPLACGR